MLITSNCVNVDASGWTLRGPQKVAAPTGLEKKKNHNNNIKKTQGLFLFCFVFFFLNLL